MNEINFNQGIFLTFEKFILKFNNIFEKLFKAQEELQRKRDEIMNKININRGIFLAFENF
jgi:hypothetical protein